MMEIALYLFRLQLETAGHASLEHPAFTQAKWLAAFILTMAAAIVSCRVVDYCMYGMEWRKSTGWWSDWIPEAFSRRCDRSHRHRELRGAT